MSRRTWGKKNEGPVRPGNWGTHYTIHVAHEMDKGKPAIETNCSVCIFESDCSCERKQKVSKTKNCSQYMRSQQYPAINEMIEKDKKVKKTDKIEFSTIYNYKKKRKYENKVKASNNQFNSVKNINQIILSSRVRKQMKHKIELLENSSDSQKYTAEVLFNSIDEYHDILDRFVLLCFDRGINPVTAIIQSHILYYLSLFCTLGEEEYDNRFRHRIWRTIDSSEIINLISGGLKLIQSTWKDLYIENRYQLDYEQYLNNFLYCQIILGLFDLNYEESVSHDDWQNYKIVEKAQLLAQWTGEVDHLFFIGELKTDLDYFSDCYKSLPIMKNQIEKAQSEILRNHPDHRMNVEVSLNLEKNGELSVDLELTSFCNLQNLEDFDSSSGKLFKCHTFLYKTFKIGRIFKHFWNLYLNSIDAKSINHFNDYLSFIQKKLKIEYLQHKTDKLKFQPLEEISYCRIIKMKKQLFEKEREQLNTYSLALCSLAKQVYDENEFENILSRFVCLCINESIDYGSLLNNLEYMYYLWYYSIYEENTFYDFLVVEGPVFYSNELIAIIGKGLDILGKEWKDVLFLNDKVILDDVYFKTIEKIANCPYSNGISKTDRRDENEVICGLSVLSKSILPTSTILARLSELKFKKNDLEVRLCKESGTNKSFIQLVARLACFFPSYLPPYNKCEYIEVLNKKFYIDTEIEKWNPILDILFQRQA